MQDQVAAFVHHERGAAQAAVHHVEMASRAAMDFEGEKARALIRESQDEADRMSKEFQAARRYEHHGEIRLRNVEQAEGTLIVQLEQRLHQTLGAREAEQNAQRAEMHGELNLMRGQNEGQNALAQRAHTETAQALTRPLAC